MFILNRFFQYQDAEANANKEEHQTPTGETGNMGNPEEQNFSINSFKFFSNASMGEAGRSRQDDHSASDSSENLESEHPLLKPPPRMRRQTSASLIIVPMDDTSSEEEEDEPEDDDDYRNFGQFRGGSSRGSDFMYSLKRFSKSMPRGETQSSFLSSHESTNILDVLSQYNENAVAARGPRILAVPSDFSVISRSEDQSPLEFNSYTGPTSSRNIITVHEIEESESENEEAARQQPIVLYSAAEKNQMQQISVDEYERTLMEAEKQHEEQVLFKLRRDDFLQSLRTIPLALRENCTAAGGSEYTKYQEQRQATFRQFLRDAQTAQHTRRRTEVGELQTTLNEIKQNQDKRLDDWAKEEAAFNRRREAHIQKLQEEERIRQEIEQKRLAEEHRQAEAQRQTAEAARQAKAKQDELARQAAEKQKAVATQQAKVKATKGSKGRYLERKQHVTQVRQKAADYKQKNKKHALKIKASIGKIIGQISATQEQVKNCVTKLKAVLQSNQGAEQTYVQLTMADMLIRSATNKIMEANSLAYTFGWILFGLAMNDPYFGGLVLCVLTESCPFTIPWFPYKVQFDTETEYVVTVGRKVVTPEEDHIIIENKHYETEPNFYRRITGFVGLFAGFIDIDSASHPKPNEGKKFLRRLHRLLQEPTYSATMAPTISCFLDIASYSLCQRYPNECFAFYGDLMANIHKFPSDTEPRKLYVDKIRIHLEAVQAQNGPSQPEARQLADYLSVQQNSITWVMN